MSMAEMDSRLELRETTWRVLGEFEFEERNSLGCAALVEGATLVLFHADDHLEAIALAELEGMELVPNRLTAMVLDYAGRRLTLQGDVHSVGALQDAARTHHRRAPAGGWLWAEPAEG
jgi:hypothetical protein